MELEKKPDFEPCMKRIYTWYNQDIIDRILEMPEINAIQWVGKKMVILQTGKPEINEPDSFDNEFYRNTKSARRKAIQN